MDVVELDGRTVSSQQRQLTVKKMTPPTDLQSALNILGDESNPNYPLFRSPRKNQLGSTVATGNCCLPNSDNPSKCWPEKDNSHYFYFC